MADAHDRPRYFCRANRFNVYRLLSAQSNVRASETVLRVISKTHHTARPFRLKSSVVYYRTGAAAFLVANEIIMRRLRAAPGAERRLLEAVLIHKHRARLSTRLIPGSSPRSTLHVAL